MSRSRYSATGHHRVFDIGPDDTDVPPSGSEEDRIAEISSATRAAASDNAIKNHVLVAFSLGLVPVPVFDFAMLTANQVKMVHALGAVHGQKALQGNRLKAVLLSLLSGALPVLGVQGLSSGLKAMPGIGSLLGSSSVAVSGGLLTYAVGRVFARHFESGGTYLSLDMKKAREQLRNEMKMGRGTVSHLWKKTQRAERSTA